MTTSDDKKKLVDIIKGEKKWRAKVFHYFKSTDASVENYLCTDSGDNQPFVEFTLLATDKDDASKKQQIFMKVNLMRLLMFYVLKKKIKSILQHFLIVHHSLRYNAV